MTILMGRTLKGPHQAEVPLAFDDWRVKYVHFFGKISGDSLFTTDNSINVYIGGTNYTDWVIR